MTLQQLADELGTSNQVLSRYERGEREADYATLAKIARFFNVSIDFLLDFTPATLPKTEQNVLPADEQELLTNFRTLPREEKVQARSYVRYLAERRAPGNKHA